MGICISSPSPKNQYVKDENENENENENGLFMEDFEMNGSHSSLSRLGSYHSQQGSKAVNQDSAILYQGFGMEGGALCGVFDGHGEDGHKVSKLVRNRLPALLLEQRDMLAYDDEEMPTSSTYMPNEWRRTCVSAFKVMDRELKLQRDFDCSCSGSTAVTILKQGQDLVIANLGDSRAILGTISPNDELKVVQLTVDLKPDLPYEAERIRKCNGRIYAHKEEPDVMRVWSPDNEMSLSMARAFGDLHMKEYGIIAIPQMTHRRITDKDQFLVLATDGVWDALSNEEVASIVWSVQSEEEAAKAVVETAVAVWRRAFPASKVDDCTAVCLFLQERKHQNNNFMTNEDNNSTLPTIIVTPV